MKKIYISLICLMTVVNIIGQDDWLPENVVPVSPGAMSLGVYGAIPVGVYGGTPNVSIPIYEIDLDGRKIPIRLSYNASGIRVAQEAGPVGLGWTLDAGGCIVKEIRGWNDFGGNQYSEWYKTEQEKAGVVLPGDRGYYFIPDLPPYDSNNNGIEISSEPQLLQYGQYERNYDGQPDFFHFNFAGYSGTFYFAKKGVNGNTDKLAKGILLNPKEQLDITYNIEGGSSGNFCITDVTGYRYYFNTKEVTTIYTASSERYREDYFSRGPALRTKEKMPDSVTSWQLDSIVSPLNNKAVFTYGTEIILTSPVVNESLDISLIENISNNLEGRMGLGEVEHGFSYSYSRISQTYLKEIRFPHGTVGFTHSPRYDLDSPAGGIKASKADRIVIKDCSGTVVKTTELEYSYLGDVSAPNTCRLLLNSVREKAGSSQIQTHKFTYNEGDLPAKNSFDTDIWGYYNGPSFRHPSQIGWDDFLTLPGLIAGGKIRKGANRLPHVDYMQRGVLTDIEYPTGGKSTFFYEPNVFWNDFECGFTSVKKSNISHDPTAHRNDTTLYGADFEITEESYASFVCGYYPVGNPVSCDVRFVLQKKLFPGQYENVCTDFYVFCKPDESNESVESRGSKDAVFLQPGTYRLVMKKELLPPYYNEPKTHDYIITAAAEIHTPRRVSFGGGLRIREIQHKEGNELLTRKVYTYEKNGTSSGLLITVPSCAKNILFDLNRYAGYPGVFAERYRLAFNGTPVSGEYAHGFFGTAYIPMTSAAGNIGYSYVEETESDKDGNTNGKTTHSFYNELSRQEVIYPGFPITIPPENGSPKETAVYDSGGKLLKKTLYEYSKETTPGSEDLKGIVVYSMPKSVRFGVKFYDLKSEWWKSTRRVVSEYSNASSGISSEVSYTYNPINLMISGQKSYDSKGTPIEERIKYCMDYNDPIHNGMKSKGMTGIPIETISMKNNLVTGARKNSYSDTLGTYLPKEVFTLALTNPLPLNSYQSSYIPRVCYDKYTSKGNPLSVSVNNGSDRTVYLWSYNYQYPVAEIKGATLSEVKTALGYGDTQLDNLARSMMPDAAAVGNTLRTYFRDKPVLITTYTYQPLVGVTSVTTPEGVITTYEYDSFGRLETVRDKDGHILDRYEYHYRNQ